jgi:hypothetical protein
MIIRLDWLFYLVLAYLQTTRRLRDTTPAATRDYLRWRYADELTRLT